jgi:Arc/MetJ-type ribon-helix-helix transcriptional regulator
MNVTLSERTQRLVEEQLVRGGYATPEEVVEAALASLTQQQNVGDFEPGELDALIAVGDAEIERGEVLDGDDALAERKRRRGNANYQ